MDVGGDFQLLLTQSECQQCFCNLLFLKAMKMVALRQVYRNGALIPQGVPNRYRRVADLLQGVVGISLDGQKSHIGFFEEVRVSCCIQTAKATLRRWLDYEELARCVHY